ncbi:hypothetical protein CBQ26_09110 [Deinococcus indicus]|uniref:Phage tail protein n=1 Tax=Deinococcus indicus TaxID=223556 RepID=A0A2D0A7Z6_9DEIO|nr:hypothetical protein [Deinococcus indicus]OWL96525.1 hypothetical protein CBQ26_09110 [Deinococcus indicus]
MTAPTPDVIYGDQSLFRFMVLTEPTAVRPANFDATALELPELSTSDMPVTIATVARDTPAMYGTPAAGGGPTSWAKPKAGQGSWTITLTGNVQPTAPQRAAMTALRAARGKYVWVERRTDAETVNEGGCALVTSTGKPIPVEGIVTFTVGLTGWGQHFEDTSTAV